MATHCSIFAWRIPWTEKPDGLQSVGSQRVRHDWVTNSFTPMDMYARGLFVRLCQCMSLRVSGCVCACLHIQRFRVEPTGLTKARGQLVGPPSTAASSAHAALITKEGCLSSPDHPRAIFLSISCCDWYKCCSNFSSFPEIYKMVYSAPVTGATRSALLLPSLFCCVVTKQREE